MAGGDAARLARITGRVQGVNYRGWARSRAEEIGVAGWVRNEPDGSVAALIQGSEAGVAEMIEALWTGPPAASVAGVAIEETEPEASQAGFRIVD